jgi:demethylspheroidene O-methyltransferase
LTEPAHVASVAASTAVPRPAVTLFDRLLGIRDRLLASPGFQRKAASFPLTRPIARRRARALFDLCAGFVYSQVLLACVRLRLFDILAEGPQTLPALSVRLSLSPEATARLVWAAVSLRLAARRGKDRFGLGDLGATMVGNPGIAAMVEHHALLYGDLQDPVALLRGESPNTELSRYWPYAAAEQPSTIDPDRVAEYSALMSASQRLIADEVLDAYPLDRHECLLDVGGGEGTFLVAAAARAPRLGLVLFDLPAVAGRAEARLAAAGLADRARVVGGDFFKDPLPVGADIVSLIRVVHDHDDAWALTLLSAVRRALAPGGTLLLAEPMAGVRGAEPIGDAYFGFYLLAMGSGRARTPGELETLLRTAGFGRIRRIPTRLPLQTGVMTARAL